MECGQPTVELEKSVGKSMTLTWPCQKTQVGFGVLGGLLMFKTIQGGFDPSKKSGVGVDFELLVRCLLLRNKDAARKPSMI